MQTRFSIACYTVAAGILSGALVQPGLSQAQAPSWDKSITVEIRAPDHKPDGKTWDMEIPVLIGALMPTMGDPAPDMMLCVVDTAGHDFCIHEAKRNQAGVPYSICPNAYICTFSNVKIPNSGYYGVLIVDLDPFPNKQDYMLAAIMRNGGPEDPDQAWKIEKGIKTLARRWNVVGAPDEFPQAAAGDCTPKDPCFGDSRGGIPSLAIGDLKVTVCGMPMSGTVEFGPGDSAGSVNFDFRMTANECPGGTQYTWSFGDGSKMTTNGPRAVHAYAGSGSFTVTVVPRCIRKTSACDAKPISTRVSIGH
jgi:hypothetical protein